MENVLKSKLLSIKKEESSENSKYETTTNTRNIPTLYK